MDKDLIQERFGQRLQKSRRLSGLSLRTLGTLTGIHYTQLWAMEHGRSLPGFHNLRALCRVLKVTGDYLLCRSGR